MTENLTNVFSVEKIMKEIANYINEDVSVIEALTYYANKHNIEIELLGSLIKKTPSFRAFVRQDAEKNLLVHSEEGENLTKFIK